MNGFSVLSAVTTDAEALQLPKIDYASIFPMLFLVGAALILLVQSSVMREKLDATFCAGFTVIAGVVSVASTWTLWGRVAEEGPRSSFAGAIVYDRFALFFVVLIGSALVLSALVSSGWLNERRIVGPEYYVLSMFSAAGAMLMAAANDLIVVFLGLEILSIALYVLVGFSRRDERSREAAIKYFVLGSFASAIFLYGIALTYGAIGSTNLTGISSFLATNSLIDDRLLFAGLGLLGVGFAFKVAAVPFHQWTPDVYAGAPTPVVGFMAAVAKAGAFAAFLRVFGSTFFVFQEDWRPAILVIAIVTLLVGCTVACVQRDIKRMLAYSSISHAGFILLGLETGTASGVAASLFYLLAYAFVVVGSFAIVTVVDGRNDSNHDLESYRGLGRSHPLLALAFTVLLLAQAGVPPTSGFLAKFHIMSALVENGSHATAVFAMLSAAVAAFFYLRVVVTMYSGGAAADSTPTSDDVVVSADGTLVLRSTIVLPIATVVAIGVAVAVTVGLGVLPQGLLDAIGFARQATADIF